MLMPPSPLLTDQSFERVHSKSSFYLTCWDLVNSPSPSKLSTLYGVGASPAIWSLMSLTGNYTLTDAQCDNGTGRSACLLIVSSYASQCVGKTKLIIIKKVKSRLLEEQRLEMLKTQCMEIRSPSGMNLPISSPVDWILKDQ
uniref:Uncharacterized protein n=1 Tax=Sphaerodactylus townsendi TaxID=933632 RepID=A0ACB8G2G7_9SAUR